MRVISGKYRHRQLFYPNNEKIRPTKDAVKEGIFSAVSPYIGNTVCLDLFAGSGALGIEALSRGARHIYLNDVNKDSINCIKKNITNLDIRDATILNFDYQIAIKNLFEKNIKVDLLILDPPYNYDYKKILDECLCILNEHSIIIIESDKKIIFEIKCIKCKDYKYGRTQVKIIWL